MHQAFQVLINKYRPFSWNLWKNLHQNSELSKRHSIFASQRRIITNDMDTIKRLPTHPGDVLKEELEIRGITQAKFATCLGVSSTMLNEILNRKRPVTSDFALLVEAALGINPELLVNMQSRYNIAQARMKPTFTTRFREIQRRAASWLL